MDAFGPFVQSDIAVNLRSQTPPQNSPTCACLCVVRRKLLFNGTQHAIKFVQRHMLFLDHTPVQVVAKANGHAIITTKPSKERAKVYRLSDEYPDDIGEWVRVAKRFGMTQTSYTCNLCFGIGIPHLMEHPKIRRLNEL